MTWVVRSLLVASGLVAVVVLATPVGAAPPPATATPRLPCLLRVCPPDLPVDPTAPPVTAPPVTVLSLPAEVPSLLEVLGLPPAAADPGAPPPAAPSPAPDGPAAGESGGGPDAAPAPDGGGDGSRPSSVGTPASSSRPAAVAHAARSFALLFVLAALVGGYLLVQGRLDARDPKLAAAPIDRDDELIRFR